jgi:hypothetical protein
MEGSVEMLICLVATTNARFDILQTHPSLMKGGLKSFHRLLLRRNA